MRLTMCALVLAVAVGAAACKQGDGPLPEKSGDVPNRLGDLQRDLQAILGGDQGAIRDFSDDLLVFTEEPEGQSAARALATTLCSMLVNRPVNDETQTRIIDLMWKAVASRELSERQVDALQDDVRNTLLAIGVTQPDANLAAGRVAEVQKAVTLRERRWYERY
jgi:hypothetical protein